MFKIAKPKIHAESSARRYGGKFEDYLPIHNFFDSSKAHLADNRHRCVFHSSFGIFIAEQVFGNYITNSDGKEVSVRAIGEDHVIEDLGVIPTLQDYLSHMEEQPWMQKATTESCPESCKGILAKRKSFRLSGSKKSAVDDNTGEGHQFSIRSTGA